VSAQLTSYLLFSFPSVISPSADVAMPSCYVTLFFHEAKTSLLPPLHHLATLHLKALNLHHYYQPSSLDHLTHILYYYKNIISILVTFLTTQPCSCLYFIFSQVKAPHHQSSTRHHYSLTNVPRSSSLHIITHTVIN
jgi:hypothetical protein